MNKTVNIRFCCEMVLDLAILALILNVTVQVHAIRKDQIANRQEISMERSFDSEIQKDEAEDTLAKEALYVLKLKQGKVVIYHASNGEEYDKTDISEEVFSEKMRQTLKQGMPVYSLKELYDFLENYSS